MLLLFFCSTQCFHSMLCIFPSTQCFQPWIFAIPLLYFKASFKIQDKPMTCEDGNYKFAPCLCFAYGQFVCCNKLFSFSNHATKLQYQERSHGRQAYQVGQAQPPEKVCAIHVQEFLGISLEICERRRCSRVALQKEHARGKPSTHQAEDQFWTIADRF